MGCDKKDNLMKRMIRNKKKMQTKDRGQKLKGKKNHNRIKLKEKSNSMDNLK